MTDSQRIYKLAEIIYEAIKETREALAEIRSATGGRASITCELDALRDLANEAADLRI